MTLRYTIDRAARVVNYVAEGANTARDFLRFFNAVMGDPAHSPGFGFLGNHRREALPDTAYVSASAGAVSDRVASLGGCRWAVLVSSAAGYGMARMWGLMTRQPGAEIAPFNTRDEAVAWLGRSPASEPFAAFLATV